MLMIVSNTPIVGHSLAFLNTMYEYTDILLILLILLLMQVTHPKKSYIYNIDRAGLILSFFESLLAILISRGTFVSNERDAALSVAFCLVYCFLYVAIITLIMEYIRFLVTRRKPVFSKFSAEWALITVAAVDYLIYYGYHGFYLNTSITPLELCYTAVKICSYNGIVTCLFALVCIIPYFKHMTRVVRYGTFILMPFEVILLTLQLFAKNTIFLGLTYTIPFVVFYIIFHSNPFNELTVHQNADALYNFIDARIKAKRPYTLIFVEFPLLRIQQSSIFDEKLVDICREIESIRAGVSIFRLDTSTYVITAISTGDGVESFTEKVKDIFDENLKSDVYLPSKHSIYVIYGDDVIKSPDMVYSFKTYLHANHPLGMETEYYIASEKDYQDFSNTFAIENLLEEIQDESNLEDSRILCYAQPIYNIETKSFRTAEALMRLGVNDKIIPPNVFIPVAEKSGYIHALTLIMLNKVCVSVKKLLDDGYDFDAITVNCSALEFADEHLFNDLTAIIDKNAIPKNKIRIEITESAIFDDYEMVMFNMGKLQQEGIEFYLDDFGTGYSNMERISSCSFHTIKFDKSVMNRAMEDPALDSLVNSYMNMMDEKGISTLVEGVEDEDQVEFSKRHGFNFIQGFKYAKPAPIEELTKYFEKTSDK